MIKWRGLDEFKTDLETMPDRLHQIGQREVPRAAHEAATAIQAAYPVRTGRLRNGVRLRPVVTAKPYTTKVDVVNLSPLALLFEIGTHGKIRYTKAGAERGPMPAGKVFRPIASRHRRLLKSRLKDLVSRAVIYLRLRDDDET